MAINTLNGLCMLYKEIVPPNTIIVPFQCHIISVVDVIKNIGIDNRCYKKNRRRNERKLVKKLRNTNGK
ncbi:hypothetical protein DERP_006026 [Dermatophagoides pteronyssinus]|uniref:Uncharacterized protein n=1 Tax=Dermatophagoides pteronyssinus TaxID=6956 RepID=A0ABQ8JSQ0_DERPT|nr:hypothetical protein DERP_006026 [Dermatophagoides pteronyssinus]